MNAFFEQYQQQQMMANARFAGLNLPQALNPAMNIKGEQEHYGGHHYDQSDENDHENDHSTTSASASGSSTSPERAHQANSSLNNSETYDTDIDESAAADRPITLAQLANEQRSASSYHQENKKQQNSNLVAAAAQMIQLISTSTSSHSSSSFSSSSSATPPSTLSPPANQGSVPNAQLSGHVKRESGVKRSIHQNGEDEGESDYDYDNDATENDHFEADYENEAETASYDEEANTERGIEAGEVLNDEPDQLTHGVVLNAANEKENVPICKFCNKMFANFSNLNHHISAIHLNQSKWICSQCDKICSSKSNLKVHLRVHLRVKPYHCRWCSYSCMHHSSIRDHLAKVHPDKTHTPLQPGYLFNSHAVPEPEVFNSKSFNVNTFVSDNNSVKVKRNDEQCEPISSSSLSSSPKCSEKQHNSYSSGSSVKGSEHDAKLSRPAKKSRLSEKAQTPNSFVQQGGIKYEAQEMAKNAQFSESMMNAAKMMPAGINASNAYLNNLYASAQSPQMPGQQTINPAHGQQGPSSISNLYNAYTMARMFPFMYNPMHLQMAAAAAAAMGTSAGNPSHPIAQSGSQMPLQHPSASLLNLMNQHPSSYHPQGHLNSQQQQMPFNYLQSAAGIPKPQPGGMSFDASSQSQLQAFLAAAAANSTGSELNKNISNKNTSVNTSTSSRFSSVSPISKSCHDEKPRSLADKSQSKLSPMNTPNKSTDCESSFSNGHVKGKLNLNSPSTKMSDSPSDAHANKNSISTISSSSGISSSSSSSPILSPSAAGVKHNNNSPKFNKMSSSVGTSTSTAVSTHKTLSIDQILSTSDSPVASRAASGVNKQTQTDFSCLSCPYCSKTSV